MRPLALALLLSVVVAGTADAAVLTYQPPRLDLDLGVAGSQVAVTTPSPGSVDIFTDEGISSGPPAGCTAVNPSTTRCPITGALVVAVLGIDAQTATGTHTIVATQSPVPIATTSAGAALDVTGSGFDDDLRSGGGVDVLRGGGGADTLRGGANSDNLIGGDGSPDAVRYDGESRVAGIAAQHNADGTGALSMPPGETDVWSGIERIVGSEQTDVVVTNAPGSSVAGVDGDDQLAIGSNAGDVTLDGGAGNDTLTGAGMGDVLLGGGANDRLDGGGGADRLDGGDGGDAGPRGGGLQDGGVFGGSGDDQLSGGTDADDLRGGQDADSLDGGAGADSVQGGTGADRADYSSRMAGVRAAVGAVGGSGNDVDGPPGSGRDTIAADVETVVGTELADELTGDDGANTLVGLGGNDLLTGGGGADSLQGGDGSDDLRGAGDQTADTLDCGPGFDAVGFDPIDTVLNCLDEDGDGSQVPADCNDVDAGVGPGAAEVPGNAVDENCDGVVAPGVVAPAKLAAVIDAAWSVGPTGSRARRLAIKKLPVGATVTLRCKAKRGCPFKTKTFRYPAGKSKVSYTSRFKRATLPVGTKVTVLIQAPDTIGRRTVYTIRRSRAPKRTILCLPPGAAAPTRC